MYFIFVHPAIIYYHTVSYSFLAQRDGGTALFYVVLSVLLWAVIWCAGLYLIYKHSFVARRNMRYLMQHGKRIEAEIIEVHKLKPAYRSTEYKALVLEARNLQGEQIWHKMQINDSMPQRRRFETGKRVYLRVDPRFEKYPYIVQEGAYGKINYLLFLLWIVFGFGVFAYYLYAYTTENNGYGWRFLTPGHPLISCAGMIFLFAGIIYLIRRFISRNSGKNRESLMVKFNGVKTMARVVKVSGTGTYINNQPQVEFNITFTDRSGTIRNLTIKKIVPLVQMNTVNVAEKEIFYLPGNPSVAFFAEDIHDF
ncbi:hypothetical protein SAMN02927921_02173 [Sinomicrobium oceani]|uniref:DUF3592 domain-containing protein n=2 Tax=Sinomicrobium oceani TaxID=1150368 RepID=A0A1K1Q1L1_9FLAO|nr:hypothetical protein SAMN02927921_02173 [Sinomicrobium oceani]